MHIVGLEKITDSETIARYDFDGDGNLGVRDLTCLSDLVAEDTNGDGAFDETDATALRADTDKADILNIWDKQIKAYAEKIGQIKQTERDEENKKYDEERTKIEEDLKNIEWYEPTPAPTPTPEPEPEPTPETEELPLLTFEPSAGDVDGDGLFDEGDVNRIRNYAQQKTQYTQYDNSLSYYDEMRRADINDDGIIDEIDFSLAVNMMNGKEIHGIPGSSEDNPLYIFGNYTSENINGEYVSNKYRGWGIIYPDKEGVDYSQEIAFIGKGDQVKFNRYYSYISSIIVSDTPHKVIVPTSTSVYDDKGKQIASSGGAVLTIDKTAAKTAIDVNGEWAHIYLDNALITGNFDYVHVEGNNCTVIGGKDIDIAGENAKIILDGIANDVTIDIIKPNCEVQSKGDNKFNITFPGPGWLYDFSLKENDNGVPALVSNGTQWVSFTGKINPETTIEIDGKKLKLENLPGADEIFKPNETNLNITNNPDNPGEWFKKYTRVANSPSETFDLQDSNGNVTGQVTVSGGNEVTFTEVNGKITLVTPNLTVDGGYVTDTKGLIGLMVDGKEYVKNSDGIATYTKEGNKLKIVANGPFDIETTDAGDNIEIYAFNGNNNITFSGKGGVVNSGHGNDNIEIKGSGNVVNTGHGNDTVKISGAGSSVYLNSGENSVTINAASFVHAGTGKDKFNVNSSGATIFDFNPNEDTLNFSLSLGKLKTEVKNIAGYQSIMIKDADTERPISALVNCSDLGKIQEIINAHNQEVVVEEASQKIDELERDFAEKLGTLVQKEISSDSIKAKAELIEELKKNIPKESSIPAKDFEKLKDRIAKEAADIIASKPEITKDVLTDNASMIDFFSKIFTKNEFSEGKYTIKMDGFGEDWANVFRIEISWKDNNKEESVILGLPATEKGIKKAISNLAKSAGEVIDEKMDEATKAVISALTGVDKKIVSNVYDIGTGILEMLITGKTNDKQLANSLINITKKQLTSAIHEMIERFGNVNGVSSSWIRAQQGKVDELEKNMEVLDKMKKDLSTLSDNSESSLKKLNDKVEATKSLLKGLFEFK
ncbi:MAG: hypothetical protein IKN43_13880 [Selenomonadaceae bacterium]|nr:hypothetical protein [Selenomonadaceae bacterium]